MYAQKRENYRAVVRRLGVLGGLVFLLTGCSLECHVSSKPIDTGSETNEYNRGFNDALNSIALLNLELQLDGERKTFGEMNEILRERFNVPEPEESQRRDEMLESVLMEILESCGRVKRLIPDSLLVRECELALGPRIDDHRFQQIISKMISAGQVAVQLGPHTGEPRHKMATPALT